MTEKTLHDEFAMAALAGILANPKTDPFKSRYLDIAEMAYDYADAAIDLRIPSEPAP